MAQVIITDQQVINTTWATWGRTILFGVVTGIVFWLLTLLIGRYIVEPLVCRQVVNAVMCTNATPLSGNIAAIIAGAISIVFMVRSNIARPIIIAVASVALLWDLAAWTVGLFWIEALVWSALLYGGTFALFSWITRYAVLWMAIALSLLIVLIIRIALVL
jgi:hypothetical protein